MASLQEKQRILKELSQLNLAEHYESVKRAIVEENQVIKLETTSFQENPPVLHFQGMYKKRPFNMEFHALLGRLPMPRTLLTLPDCQFSFSASLTPEVGFLVKIGKLLWLKDSEIGVADFDGKFVIKTKDVELLRTYLTKERQHALTSLLHAPGTTHLHITCKDSTLKIEHHGILTPKSLPFFAKICEVF